jgi:hypothetical protein
MCHGGLSMFFALLTDGARRLSGGKDGVNRQVAPFSPNICGQCLAVGLRRWLKRARQMERWLASAVSMPARKSSHPVSLWLLLSAF